jgi:hypothetical protein
MNCLQLFDVHNPVNIHYERLLFTTEGHILPIDGRFRQSQSYSPPLPSIIREDETTRTNTQSNNRRNISVIESAQCQSYASYRRHLPPIDRQYMQQLYDLVGIPFAGQS